MSTKTTRRRFLNIVLCCFTQAIQIFFSVSNAAWPKLSGGIGTWWLTGKPGIILEFPRHELRYLPLVSATTTSLLRIPNDLCNKLSIGSTTKVKLDALSFPRNSATTHSPHYFFRRPDRSNPLFSACRPWLCSLPTLCRTQHFAID